MYVSERDYERSVAGTRVGTGDVEAARGVSTREDKADEESQRGSGMPKKRLLI